MLLSVLPALLFYSLTYQSKLLPRFIAIWGFIAIPFMMSSMILNLFDLPSSSLLLAPFGLNQLFLAVWLVVKGFNTN